MGAGQRGGEPGLAVLGQPGRLWMRRKAGWTQEGGVGAEGASRLRGGEWFPGIWKTREGETGPELAARDAPPQGWGESQQGGGVAFCQKS